jgi:hypothetical protein
MAFSINNLMVDDGDSIFYDPEFHVTMESHMPWLRQLASTTTITLLPIDSVKYDADLGGLLQKYNVPVCYHWIVMRMNKLNSPSEFNSTITSLLIPSGDAIESLRRVLATVYSVV